METLLICLMLAYLIGSLPFAVIVSRVFGLADPRSFGSGNPGATNVLRTGNKAAAVITLLGDAGKGWLAMVVVAKVDVDGTAIALAGLAAFLGHLFPVFLRFKGGKGVATAVGVLLGLDGWLALGALIIWLTTAALTRYSSLAALVAAGCTPILTAWLHGVGVMSGIVTIMCALLVWRHQENIRRLLAGSETRIGAAKKSGVTSP